MKRLTTSDVLASFTNGEIMAETFEPLAVDDGQRVLVDTLTALTASGETVAGYKVGLTSGAARDAFGQGVRPFGFILADYLLPSGATINREHIGRLGLENEVAFRIGELPAETEITPAMARAAVIGVAPAFEINQERVRGQASAGLRVADNLSQWGVVVGDFLTEIPPLDDLTAEARLGGDLLHRGLAAGNIDDHFLSIARLANQLRAFDLVLFPGAVVITGSLTRFPVTEPGQYTGDFGQIGEVVINVT